jgi:hypothetical protein
MKTNRNRHLLTLAILTGSVLLATAAGGPAPATLVRPATAEKAPSAEGFIQRWLILEPIQVNGDPTDRAVQATVRTEYFPNQLTMIPHDGDKVTVNGTELTWHAEDTVNYNVNLYHFGNLLNKPSSSVLFWVVTIVNCPEEMKDVRLAIGSNDASVWWVNGEEVTGIYGDRQTVVDDGVSKRLTLKKGPNVIRGAIHNRAGATDFCARLLDADGIPIKNFTVSVGNSGK